MSFSYEDRIPNKYGMVQGVSTPTFLRSTRIHQHISLRVSIGAIVVTVRTHVKADPIGLTAVDIGSPQKQPGQPSGRHG